MTASLRNFTCQTRDNAHYRLNGLVARELRWRGHLTNASPQL
jgi:hypothetical protein